MKRFTLRAVLLLAFLGLAGSATTSCLVRTRRGHHRHAVKHRHEKHKKYKKRHHDNGRHRGDRHHH